MRKLIGWTAQLVEGSRRSWSRAMGPLRRWIASCVDLLYPPQCCFCFAEIEPRSTADVDNRRPVVTCPKCRELLVVDPWPGCRRCGQVLEGGPADECPHCREHHFAFDAVAVLGRYEADLRLAVHRMKQPTGEALAEALGRTLAQHRAAQFSQFHPDCLVPVPMYWTRRLWRRTNDAEAIARGLAAVLAIPVLWRAVRRVRHTELQRDMRVDERMRNVRGAFAVARPAAVAGRRVLLVDDVFTSGATTGELARVLKKAGAEAVAVAVIARAQGLSAT